MSKMQIIIDSVINWFQISLMKDYFKLAREKIYDAINDGYKKLGDLSSSLLQISHKYRKKLGERISSDNRSLIRKSDNYYREKQTLKVLHTTISEYWRDVLFNHWFILTQCLILAVVIIVTSPWIGSD
ncbi:uncharacterized protein LOC117171187 [Belonocnema kinseyi]|uniref:uncharacterized protein LOC117171187 n=1 Tax=Belonocnema kinseyi TaxID=2817044 RepID=UPI00143D78E5|nr:uncharacterized protein LOC117171187 [Belonocnema kinseyi]